jgi:hypothetical protein
MPTGSGSSASAGSTEGITRADLERFLGILAEYRAALARYHLDPDEQEETLLGLLREIAAGPSGKIST